MLLRSFLCLLLCPVFKGAKKRTSSEAAKKGQPDHIGPPAARLPSLSKK
jgi:hypothetical protein